MAVTACSHTSSCFLYEPDAEEQLLLHLQCTTFRTWSGATGPSCEMGLSRPCDKFQPQSVATRFELPNVTTITTCKCIHLHAVLYHFLMAVKFRHKSSTDTSIAKCMHAYPAACGITIKPGCRCPLQQLSLVQHLHVMQQHLMLPTQSRYLHHLWPGMTNCNSML